jgi:hypothetical protein
LQQDIRAVERKNNLKGAQQAELKKLMDDYDRCVGECAQLEDEITRDAAILHPDDLTELTQEFAAYKYVSHPAMLHIRLIP